ncbi:hypothetical protein BC939DRAFT_152635 [Gamsiella multidivaricata]|uniref:uncharacterized protein n=1 Tax=Gamsiella multidivaricata TaxID=101098 RepID=UPI002220721F|nr:uncharacterized protein BC939DRAFT_152635 [Gamsiella multidivaricata]KAG0369967.1 hypothetical protein BGZ54_008270 [Gamsiella multidivaricata]KAI7824068.1 hypothetical protein BC939DRAFT_152635 [Gamsiella multidivaricata]
MPLALCKILVCTSDPFDLVIISIGSAALIAIQPMDNAPRKAVKPTVAVTNDAADRGASAVNKNQATNLVKVVAPEPAIVALVVNSAPSIPTQQWWDCREGKCVELTKRGWLCRNDATYGGLCDVHRTDLPKCQHFSEWKQGLCLKTVVDEKQMRCEIHKTGRTDQCRKYIYAKGRHCLNKGEYSGYCAYHPNGGSRWV